MPIPSLTGAFLKYYVSFFCKTRCINPYRACRVVGQSPTWFAFSTYHHAPDHFKRVWQCFVRGFNHSTANRISLCPLSSFLRIIVDYFCHLVYVFTRMIIVQNLYCIRKNLFYRFPYPSRSVSHYTQPYIPFRYQSRLLHLYQAFLQLFVALDLVPAKHVLDSGTVNEIEPESLFFFSIRLPISLSLPLPSFFLYLSPPPRLVAWARVRHQS